MNQMKPTKYLACALAVIAFAAALRRPSIALDVGLNRFTDWVSTQPIPDDQLERANAELKARKLMA